jgi:hypothetical protein
MPASALARWSGPALLLWAVCLVVKDSIFAFTHGSSTAAMSGTFLGLDASQYSVVWTPLPLLAAVGLAGLRTRLSPGLGRVGSVGLALALAGALLSFVAGVLQFWILDVDVYFYSPLVFGGWILALVSYLVLAIGLVLAGLSLRRSNAVAGGGSVVLLIGLLALPTLFIRSWVVGDSDDTLPWRLLYVSVMVPWALCWARLGLSVSANDRQAGPVQRTSIAR